MMNIEIQMLQNNKWQKYYTPKNVANEIISMIPNNFTPNSAIDICVGSGNFLKAVSRNWENTKLIGFDINQIDGNQQVEYKFKRIDALDIKDLILKTANYQSKKIVLANPPFGRISSNVNYINEIEDYSQIHKEAIKTNRVEALMLVSNLIILKNGDYFGAVIPENFFSSKCLCKFKSMFENFFDNIVTGNSKTCFSGSEVKTRVFIGCFNDNKEHCNIKKKSQEKHFKYKLLRGIDNSKLIKENGSIRDFSYKEVLHFSNKFGIIKKKRFIKENLKYKNLIVSKNDSLILRVGRNTGNSYSVNKSYLHKYVSDYFYLLKGVKLKKLEHINLNNLLLKKRKGLTYNYISKIDIIDSLNEILNNRKN